MQKTVKFCAGILILSATCLVGGTSFFDAYAAAPNAEFWSVGRTNQYSADPVIARRLRCAALVEAIGTAYFSPVGFHYDPGERLRMKEMIPETPRMPAADVREREAYAQAFFSLYDSAEALGKSKKGYSRKDFYGWYGDDEKTEAIQKVRGRVAYKALAAPSLSCFEYPQIAALQPSIKARLAKPVPGTENPSSPRIQPAWMPMRNVGYMYNPESYRYLSCAGIAQAVAKSRFGDMPPPDLPDVPGWAKGQIGARLGDAALVERSAYRKAVRDTFQAGHKTLIATTAAERQSYRESFTYATYGGEALVKNKVVAEAMAEPTLRCSEIPSMAPVLQRAAGTISAPIDANGPDVMAKPAGFVTWPDRTRGYFANPTAFRNLFCAALVDTAFNRKAAASDWFAPPSERNRKWTRPPGLSDPDPSGSPAQKAEALRAKNAVYALYDAGKIDDNARKTGNMFISDYARDYRRAADNAQAIIEQNRGLAAIGHASTNCLALPDLAPLADAIRRRMRQ